MQEIESTNYKPFADLSAIPREGRIIAMDPGTKRCGIAVCDKTQLVSRAVETIERSSWKKLLLRVKELVSEFDAKALVIGLPLESDGSESEMSAEARRIARNFSLSLEIPVVLEDERVTSYDAKGRLWAGGATLDQARRKVDSEAAAIILDDFLERLRSES